MTYVLFAPTRVDNRPALRLFAATDVTSPWITLILLALGAQLALIWTHVPWADELQATALARESHALSDWYWNFRYEGHAPLWHLLLKIPLALTDDPTALKIVQTLVVLCSAALLHLRAPFSPGFKFLLSLNYFLFFEYGVIARDYSLTVLFFFGAIAFRRQPVAWFFIALLPQGGLQSIMLAGICGIIVLREQGWKWWGAALAACGGLVALVWMWPEKDFGSLATLRLENQWFDRFIRAAYLNGASLLPVDFDLSLTGWEPSQAALLIGFLGLVGPIFLIRTIARKSPLMAMLTTMFIAANFYLAVFIYLLQMRHLGLWVLLVIGLLWVTNKADERPKGPLALWMIILALSGPVAGLRQILTPVFATRQTAEALREAGAEDRLIIPAYVLLGAEVNGMLRLPTYDMAGGCLQTFVRWRKPVFMGPSKQDFDTQGDLEDKARIGLADMKKAAARAGGRALLVLSYTTGATLSLIEDPSLTFLRFIGKDAIDEQWRYLYALDVPPDPNPTPIPACTR
jgi:hypothetical protein